ncbi:hypothetical protein NLY36_20135 [Mesorhizobium sp. C399B]|uniref:hypothetical protein n=1 Tax=Mesorhizobium sp. C399B TaxID=2956833 RepID=UPI002578FC3F|nr:hypothetical protein [Mesorhizobium sp. C399B]WJI67203.1 hypothetical protein NLY36_20135 [Mesorhizobium sp. C399B]
MSDIYELCNHRSLPQSNGKRHINKPAETLSAMKRVVRFLRIPAPSVMPDLCYPRSCSVIAMKDDIFEQPSHTCCMKKAVGVYRCPGNPPFVCVVERDKASFLTQAAYREAGHKPDFHALPWEAEHRAVKERQVNGTALAERDGAR